MIKRLRSYYAWRQVRQALQKRMRAGYGCAARSWPVEQQDLSSLAQEVRIWLEEQVSMTGTPYGYSNLGITLRIRTIAGQQRTIRWEAALPWSTRREAQSALDMAYTQILTLPIINYPETTQLEVILISFGELLYQAMIDSGYR